MPFTVRIDSASSTHGPIKVPDGFLADVTNPTPLEVAAEFARRVAEDHRALLGDRAGDLGFRAPLTITIEDA